MLLITFYLVSFLAGMVIGFWSLGEFQDHFDTKKEYNRHMLSVLTVCFAGIFVMLRFHQYL